MESIEAVVGRRDVVVHLVSRCRRRVDWERLEYKAGNRSRMAGGIGSWGVVSMVVGGWEEDLPPMTGLLYPMGPSREE